MTAGYANSRLRPLDRSYVEQFATMANEELGDTVVVAMLLPWSDGNVPIGVLAPGGDNSLTLNAQEVETAVQNRQVVLLPCTYDNQREEAAARQVVPQFSTFEHVCVMMAHILPPDVVLDREMNDTIMRRHDVMIQNGADEVLMGPTLDPVALRRAITVAKASWDLNVRRMQMMLDAEPEAVDAQRFYQLQQQHRRLLWESTPKALMPHLAQIDKHLVESAQRVGKFTLMQKADTRKGLVVFASEDSQPCAIKVYNKANVFTPGEVESIYREYRFLSEILRHPNIVRCVSLMHSTARVYLVFEFAGNLNLQQTLSKHPGERFEQEQALGAFDQISQALSFCHLKEVSHRSISLEHVVVNGQPGDMTTAHYQLCDFCCAMVARVGTTSKTLCGSLPCIAPEVAAGDAYTPRFIDCWSVGALLCEMSGGLGSLSVAVPFTLSMELTAAAPPINEFFSTENCHAVALSKTGGVQSQKIERILQALLKPIGEERSTMQAVLDMRK